ncbi:ribosome biogenesis protein NOP53-like isoform X2 [Acanthaster planci]|uniref:Ribosome biogenesis protein NOP53 n=1 Tax=Acanthaster planci TaxID=133434 RepID=A0A8B7Y9A1_ACAPL|nr:ribosome biogenesis protein NOP53-like isoform X2 [Acanthaster planci]
MAELPKVSKRKRVAKNRKKAWRKYSNIQDVEDFLEEQRQQLRTGGLASEKKDQDLFFEDKKAPKAVKKNTVKKRGPIQHKVDWRLLPNPRVPPAPKAFPRKAKRPGKRVLEVRAKESQGLVSANKRRRLKESEEQRSLYQETRQREKTRQEIGRATYDVWGDNAAKVIKKGGIEADEHFLRVTKNKRTKLPPRYQDKPSKLPAVEIVAPGASYNPSLEDHQALINATYEEELKKQKDEDRLERWHKIPKLTAQQVQETFISEMSAGLFPEEADCGTGPVTAGGEGDDVLPNPPTTYENRKTKKRKRKEKELKEKEKQVKAEKLQRIRQNEVYRLRSIKKEIAEEAAKSEAERAKREQRKKEMENVPKAFGHHKLEEEPMVIKLSDELVGSLRELKPEGHLLRDRYKSFQKRNIIETRTWKRGQKAQYKEYEKKSHKEITA